METRAQHILTPAHEQAEPALVIDSETFTPEQIDIQQHELEDLQERASNLKAQIRQAKDTLNAMASRVSVPPGDFREWVFRMFWFSGVPVSALQKAVKSRMGDENRTWHPTWKTIIEGTIEWPCDQCGIKIARTFSSKTALARAKSSSFLCPSCQGQKGQESAAQTQRYQERQARESERLGELRSMPYTEYLQSPHWHATREAALKRARFKCQLCNANKKLHVHHKTYDRLGAEYASDLIVLCSNCHAKFHDKEPQ